VEGAPGEGVDSTLLHPFSGSFVLATSLLNPLSLRDPQSLKGKGCVEVGPSHRDDLRSLIGDFQRVENVVFDPYPCRTSSANYVVVLG